MGWKHRVEYHPGSAEVAWLDALGDEGWEVVMAEPEYEERGLMAPVRVGYHWLFKRLENERPEGAIDRAFREFKEQNPGVSASLGPATAAETRKKRVLSPEHIAKMRAARWGTKSPEPKPKEGHDADAAE